MKAYLQDLENIMTNGVVRQDRTGVGTIGLFGMQTRYNLEYGFPAMTTKKLAWKAVVSELLWFLSGSGDERQLAKILHGPDYDNKQTIWTANAQADYWAPKAEFPGDLGRVYGVQWRSWQTSDGRTVDQIKDLVDGIKKDPFGRRHILTAWNPGELGQMALPPCHIMAQFYVAHGKLSCQMYQRSADFFLGVPFNIASYALLTRMMAQVTGLRAGEFIHTIGDAHVYLNHKEAVEEQLSRKPVDPPLLEINPEVDEIDNFVMNDFKLVNYHPLDAIKAPMAV